MIKKLFELFHKYIETIKYFFFGVLTVLVNTGAYWALALIMEDIAANTIAFFVAILFAYFTNCIFVFKNRVTFKNFFWFILVRIGTLPIDNFGLWLLLKAGMKNIIAKMIINVIIIIINYIVSKFFIFKKKKEENNE